MKRHYLLIIALTTLFLVPTGVFAGPQVSALQVGSRPTGLALGADGTLFISHGDSYTLSTIAPDGTTGSVNVGTLPLTPLIDNALGRVFVANRVEGTLSVIEMHAGSPTVVNTLSLGGAATAAALDTSRHLVYVAVQPNQLVAIDGATLAIKWSSTMGWNPRALAVDEARGQVAALSYDDSLLTWFSADGAQLSQAFVGFETRRFAGVEVRPGTGGGKPEVRTKWEIVRVQTQPSAVAIDSASGMAWVTNELNAELVGIDLAGKVPNRYHVGVNPRSLEVLNGTAYVANWGENTVSIVTLADGTTNSVLVGYAPSDIGIDHVRNLIYVAEAGRNTLGRIDGATLAYSYLRVGQAPDALFIDPAAGRVFVANHGADTVSVVTE